MARELGIVAQDEAEIAGVFSGNQTANGSAPLAQAYSGHQFGYFNPQLGDGRALLLGEVIDQSGIRRDIQLRDQGAPFSRSGMDARGWVQCCAISSVRGDARHGHSNHPRPSRSQQW